MPPAGRGGTGDCHALPANRSAGWQQAAQLRHAAMVHAAHWQPVAAARLAHLRPAAASVPKMSSLLPTTFSFCARRGH